MSSYLAQQFTKPLPPPPPMRAKDICLTTRGPSEAELQQTSALKMLVVNRYWVDDLKAAARKLINCVTYDADHPDYITWIANTDQEKTACTLPPVMNSEADTRDCILRVLCRAALLIIQAGKDQKIHTIPDFKNCEGYIVSAPGDAPIPDGLLCMGIYNPQVALPCVATLEYKTPNAFPVHTFQDILPDDKKKPPRTRTSVPAIRFGWPSDVYVSGAKNKILVQVWGQMHKWKTNYAFLSSYETTIFFRKDPNYPEALFMSREYFAEGTDVLLATIAVMAKSLGTIKEVHTTIKPTTAHWVGNNDEPGIDPQTIV